MNTQVILWKKIYLKQLNKIENELICQQLLLTEHGEEPQRTNQQQFIPIPYRLNNNRQVKRILKKSNYKKAYKRAPTIYNILRNDKDKYDDQYKSGIYKIPLVDLNTRQNKAYISATGRNFKDRIKEHKDDIKKANLTTALAAYAYESNVDYYITGIKLK